MLKPLRYLPYLGCFINKNKLFEVTYFVTNRCNFKCPFCFNDKLDADMSLFDLRVLAKRLGKFCRLLLSGGEPFLRFDLDKICHIFIKECNVVHITVPTNGFHTKRICHFVEDVCSYRNDVIVNISLSMDAIGERRDSLVRVSGSWEHLLKTAERLKDLKQKYRNLYYGTITTQCAQNEKRLNEIYDHRIGDYFSFNRARGTEVDMNIYRDFTAFLMRNNKRNFNVPLYDFKTKYVYKAVRSKTVLPCYAGRLRKVISSDGKIYPCETKMFGGGCPCWHECDLAMSVVFDPLRAVTVLNGK